MRQVSITQLRYQFRKIEDWLRRGEEIAITRRGRVVAPLVPDGNATRKATPDFLARLRSIYGEKVMAVSGATLISEDRERNDPAR